MNEDMRTYIRLDAEIGKWIDGIVHDRTRNPDRLSRAGIINKLLRQTKEAEDVSTRA